MESIKLTTICVKSKNMSVQFIVPVHWIVTAMWILWISTLLRCHKVNIELVWGDILGLKPWWSEVLQDLSANKEFMLIVYLEYFNNFKTIVEQVVMYYNIKLFEDFLSLFSVMYSNGSWWLQFVPPLDPYIHTVRCSLSYNQLCLCPELVMNTIRRLANNH